MKNILKELYISIGYRFFTTEDLHIKRIENGYLFNGKYYKNLKSARSDMYKAVERYFNE